MVESKNSNAMTVTLKPDLEEELTARARAEGLSTEEFVNRELERLVASGRASSKLSSAERLRFWNEWLNSHDYIQAPLLSDEAISRETIYREREEKQL